ncbi:unnamed protein product [Adineta steineri]|uniref:Metalloendopeptidase n=1 Tax=Adineta steineri TaxID=433720 RepID=A0A814ZH65_9BILA|nr:unnamed protein product [Adineta steineri]CAF1243181.1 unnamed protein product [Adineta steineri]CAF1262904.1 unnamed protein product [Adineta steineri]
MSRKTFKTRLLPSDISESDWDPYGAHAVHKLHDNDEDDYADDNSFRYVISDDHDNEDEPNYEEASNEVPDYGESSDEEPGYVETGSEDSSDEELSYVESSSEESSSEETNDEEQKYCAFPFTKTNTGRSTIAISANIAPDARRWDGMKLKNVIADNARTNKEPIIVYYYFATNMKRKENYKKVVKEAIQDIEAAAPGIKFKNSDTAQNCIRIYYSSKHESRSAAGMRGGKQTLELGWAKKGNALHELMHALGFLHQHQREDRSKHVSVRASKKNNPNYKKKGVHGGGRYDAHSIMHYPCNTNMRGIKLWARCNRECLSNGDKIALNVLYPPVKGAREWYPMRGNTNLYYCRKKNMNDNNAPFGRVDSNGFCGPDNGPNCHICRCYGGILERENDQGYPAKQGETGLFYCGRKIKTEKKQKRHDGKCGPDNGNNCESCSRLLR